MKKMKIFFKENFKSGSDVYYAEDISKGFGYGSNRKQLFEHVDLDIKRGERICIVGPNGIGKTTLLRILMEEIRPDSGYLKKGHNVDPGYYDQAQERMTGDNTLLEELTDSFRLYSDTEMRSILGRFLFTDDPVFLKVSDLSGGEKARLSLVKLMLSGANVLIMDEPTNHLDINSKEVFEDALMDFPGAMIIVSHDRYFLNKIPTRILELGRNGVTEYLGKYDYYEEKKQKLQASGKAYLKEMSKDGSSGNTDTGNADGGKAGGASGGGEDGALSSAEERKLRKEKEAEERRLRRKKESIEAEIEKLEEKSAELEAALWKASEEGRYPVLCAQSPCLHRMKKVMHKMKLYEPAEFIMKYLVPRLDFHPIDRPIALHITCSTRQMGVADDLIALAKMCSTKVFLPEEVGCCGFAGDRGFTFPELNKYGLRKLRPQIEANHIEVGYSNSRTCEIGLETNTGIPYMSIVYLVNECTTPKAPIE